MTDFLSPKERSIRTAAISSRVNKTTELRMIDLLRANRITGWRRHLCLPGRPDFVFHKEKVVVFVDGCFWHGCPHCYRSPSSRKEFWRNKIEGNRKRDRWVAIQLRPSGWSVIRVKECSVKKRPVTTVSRIQRKLYERQT